MEDKINRAGLRESHIHSDLQFVRFISDGRETGEVANSQYWIISRLVLKYVPGDEYFTKREDCAQQGLRGNTPEMLTEEVLHYAQDSFKVKFMFSYFSF